MFDREKFGGISLYYPRVLISRGHHSSLHGEKRTYVSQIFLSKLLFLLQTLNLV